MTYCSCYKEARKQAIADVFKELEIELLQYNRFGHQTRRDIKCVIAYTKKKLMGEDA